MKKTLGFLIIFGLLAAASASAAGPLPKRGDVMTATPDAYSATWVTGVSQDGGIKGQSLAMTDFAYYSFRNWWDQELSAVTKIEASFKAAEGTVNSGGSPRFSLMLDVNADGFNDLDDGTVDAGDVDVNVFLDPATCSDLSVDGWMVANFTGDLTNCTITDSTGATYTSDISGSAWSKLVAAYPDAKVWFMFLVQDATTGTNYVDRIKLDSSFFTKQP
jgi:hypothetical protein